MHLIGTNFQSQHNPDRFFILREDIHNPGTLDFFCEHPDCWNHEIVDLYTVEVEGCEVVVPADRYITIGDVEGRIDCILPGDISGRMFEALVIRNSLEQGGYRLSPIRVTGYQSEGEIVMPKVGLNGALPVCISSEMAMIISSTDIYGSIGRFSLADVL